MLLKKGLIFSDCIFLIIIILFTPLSLYIFNMDYYMSLYEENGVFKSLEREDVINLTQSLFSFFKYGKEIEKVKLKSGIEFFTEDEIKHLMDVRVLLGKIFILYYSSILLMIVSLFFLLKEGILPFIRSLGKIFVISSATVLTFGMALYFLSHDFDFLFEKFHVLFFPQGNYVFPQNSLIITLFPAGFFYNFFERLVTGVLIFSIVFLVLGVLSINLPKIFKIQKGRST